MSEQPTKTEGQEEATYDHIIKYTGLFGGVQGLTMLVGIIRNKLTATLLGPSGLALINIYNNVLKLLNNSTNFGISFSAVRNVSELFDEGDTKKISNFVAKDLRVQLFDKGELVYERPSVEEIKQHCAEQVDALWDEMLRFENPQTYYVDLSHDLWELKKNMIEETAAMNEI